MPAGGVSVHFRRAQKIGRCAWLLKIKLPPNGMLIVDDHPMMRTGLAQLIDNEGDLKVCAEADNAGQAINAVARQKFDLVLVDISLPDKNGLELIKDLRTLEPGPADSRRLDARRNDLCRARAAGRRRAATS